MSDILKSFKVKRFIIAVSFTVILIVTTHIPQEFMPNRLENIGLDKLEHFVAYGIVTLLFILSLKNPFTLSWAVIFFFIISGIGAADELSQPLVNRGCSLFDWLADVIGIITVLLSFLYFTSSSRRASPNVD